MDRRLLIAAVIAALSDTRGEPTRPTLIAATIGERTLTGEVCNALEMLRRDGVVRLASKAGRVLGYQLTRDGERYEAAAKAAVWRARYDEQRGAVA